MFKYSKIPVWVIILVRNSRRLIYYIIRKSHQNSQMLPCTDYGHTIAKSQILILIPNKCLVFGYKGIICCRNNSILIENRSNGKHEQGTHSIKMGADKLAENTPNVPKSICPNCMHKPKSSVFQSETLGETIE